MSQRAPRGNGGELQALQHHRSGLQLRLSDIDLELDQLKEQKALAGPKEKLRFNQPIAELTHQRTETALEYDAIQDRIAAVRAAQRPAPITVQPVRLPHITRQEAERAGVAAFLMKRVTPPESPGARRSPGTITPH